MREPGNAFLVTLAGVVCLLPWGPTPSLGADVVSPQRGVWAVSPTAAVTPEFAPGLAASGEPRIAIFGPRNGQAAGQVVAVADAPVRGSVGGLTGPGGTIPAAAVAVRYASNRTDLGGGTNAAPDLMPFFDALSDTPLAGQRVQPVWVIAEIPRLTAPGVYSGTLTLSGGLAAAVPVQVQVTGFAMPNQAERKNWLGLVQGIDTVSDRYGAPLYSDRHFELLGKSFELLGKLGQSVLTVPVIEQNFSGMTRGLVTFARRGRDLAPDFTALDRYVALHIRHCGIPRVAVVELWQVYMAMRDNESIAGRDRAQAVLSVQTATGYETVQAPLYPTNAAFWQDLYSGIREHLLKAGVPAQAICLGFYSDRRPSEEQVRFWRQVDPELGWAGYTHGYAGYAPPGNAKVTYCEIPDARPGDFSAGPDKPFRMKMGWNADTPFVTSVRGWNEDTMPPVGWRRLPDAALGWCQTGRSKGMGRIGFDCWRIACPGRPGRWYSRMDPNGQLYSKHGRLIRGNSRALVAAGPDGATATVRYLMFREGLQDLEARIAVEQAVVSQPADASFVEQAGRALADGWAYLKRPEDDRRPFTVFLAADERWAEPALELQSLAAKAQAR